MTQLPTALSYSINKPDSKDLTFKIWKNDSENPFSDLSRYNYFTLICLNKGNITLKADLATHQVQENAVLFFSPYQPFKLETDEVLDLTIINFHPDFFCILKHQKEVSCNGVLFNNLYDTPFVQLNNQQRAMLDILLQQMIDEIQQQELAQYDLLVSYLKIFLIHTTRFKTQEQDAHSQNEAVVSVPERPVLQKLKEHIEQYFIKEHSQSFYADSLNISLKALGKITKKHFDKSPSEMIQERLMMEAKRELYLTDKSVKEIAYNLGFDDEYYFSRLFKKNTDTSPLHYRTTVGEEQARKLNIEF